jgi:transcriptional regulator with XRE-family HTH domain
MSQPLTIPKNRSFAARALRLDAAIKAAGMDLRELGERIDLKTSGARTQWRKGESPQEDRWEDAAKVLGVDPDWLNDGIGTPPKPVATCLAWILSDPDLPPDLRQDSKPMFSRRRKQSANGNLVDAAKALEDSGL